MKPENLFLLAIVAGGLYYLMKVKPAQEAAAKIAAQTGTNVTA